MGIRTLNLIFLVLVSCFGCGTNIKDEKKGNYNGLFFKLDRVTLDFVVDRQEDGCRLPRMYLSFSVMNNSPNKVELCKNGRFNFCSFHSVPPDLIVSFEKNLPLIDTFKYKGILTNLVCVNKPIIIEPNQSIDAEFVVAVKIFSSSINSTLSELDDYLINLKSIKQLKIDAQQVGVINNKNYELVLKLDDRIVERTDTIAMMKRVNNDLEPLNR